MRVAPGAISLLEEAVHLLRRAPRTALVCHVVGAMPFALALLLFRILDIWKPWPARWAERHVKGGLGIMLDDLFAALYAMLSLLVLLTLGGVPGVRS